MAGSFSVEPEPLPLNRPSKLLGVFRRTDVGGGNIKYKLLPNIRVLSIEAPGQGAQTGSARFRYAFGDPLGDPILDPRRIEHVYPLDAKGDRVIKNDDRLVVRAMAETGEQVIMFDGFVRTPQADLNAMTETATFEAAGTPIKEWMIPLGGPVMRDADDPMEGDDHVVPAMRTRFNPDGRPNCTPEDADSGDVEGDEHAKFIGPIWPKNEIKGEKIRYWTLIEAAKYIIVQGNPSEEFTTRDGLIGLTGAGLLSRLVSIRPKEEGGVIDWDDSETYETADIEVEDMDITGAAWPEALERLLEPHGFAMRFALSDKEGELPEDAEEGDTVPTDPDWRLEIYRIDKPVRVKSLKLQKAGATFDPAKTNVKELRLARDTSDVENLVILDTAPKLVEASFMLAPNFQPDPDDVNNLKDFEVEDPPEDYREWIFDECGEGHFDLETELWVEDDAGDFTKVLTGEDEDEDRKFVRRRRPGISKLVTIDEQGKSLTWRLHVAKEYTGPIPGVYNKSGEWQEVSTSEWSLMDDRLGVRFKGKSPNAVNAGVPAEGEPDVYGSGGLLNLVEWCAIPTAERPIPKFRLTCTIEADEDMGIQADWRQAVSITDRPIERHHDVRDRFRQRIVSQYSALHHLNFGEDPDASHFQENDEEEAQAYADAIRKAREAGAFAGTITLHGIRLSYAVGDKIDGIRGRGVSLRANLGESEDESPVYPTVVALRWDLDGEQKTVFQIQDLRAEPPPRRRRVRED